MSPILFIRYTEDIIKLISQFLSKVEKRYRYVSNLSISMNIDMVLL